MRHTAALIIVIAVIVILSIATTAYLPVLSDQIGITTEEQEHERTFSTKRNNTKQQESLLKLNIDTAIAITTVEK